MTHILVKFMQDKQYVQNFLDGCLYMNTLEYFWKPKVKQIDGTISKIENSVQRDPFEGTVANISINKFPNLVKTFGKEHIIPNVSLAIGGYKYCNVFCMSCINIETVKHERGYSLCDVRIPSMKDFGQYAVVIDNEQIFLQRIAKSISKTYYKFICGEVHYHDFLEGYDYLKQRPHLIMEMEPEIYIRKYLKGNACQVFDSFDKNETNLRQQEWRLAMYRGVKDVNAYKLQIGDIRDIAHYVSYDELSDDINDVVRSNSIYCVDGYYGNIDREALKYLFYELGDYRGRIICGLM